MYHRIPSQKQIDSTLKEGVIYPGEVRPGTIVYVETVRNLYEFTFSSTGISLSSSNKMLLDNQPCIIVGSITLNDELFQGMIINDACLIVDLRTKKIKTSLIVAASIYTEGWHYDLWT